MWSTIAEEVKIVNDSMTCFRQWGDQRGLKNSDLFNKSYSLKIVICPWKFLEKSLKFVYLKLYEPCASCGQKGLYWKLSGKKKQEYSIIPSMWRTNLSCPKADKLEVIFGTSIFSCSSTCMFAIFAWISRCLAWLSTALEKALHSGAKSSQGRPTNKYCGPKIINNTINFY